MIIESEGRLLHFYARKTGSKFSYVNGHQSDSTLCRNLPKWSDNIPWSPERKLHKLLRQARRRFRRLTEARLHEINLERAFGKHFPFSS